MSKTSIEWTEKTWNPVGGCRRKSPGCLNCYAERVAYRMAHNPNAKISGRYDGLTQITNGRPGWTGKTFIDEEVLLQPLRRRKPTTYFISLSDLFYDERPDEDIDRVFAAMALTPQHTYQILTKYPERMQTYLGSGERHTPIIAAMNSVANVNAAAIRWPLPNVHLGVSVEDQKHADERILLLLGTPAALRFVSYEPALGPVDFSKLLTPRDPDNPDSGSEHSRTDGEDTPESLIPTGPASAKAETERVGAIQQVAGRRGVRSQIDWIIVGGESGPGARPFDIQWARQTIAQCRASGVPVFVKQLGARAYDNGLAWARCSHCGWVGLNADLPQGDEHQCGRDECPSCGTGGCITCCYETEDDALAGECAGEGSTAIKFRDKKGGDMDEWAEDLRVREMPEVRNGL